MFNIDSFIISCENMKIVDYYVTPPDTEYIMDYGFESIGDKLKAIKDAIMKFIQDVIEKFRKWRADRKRKKAEKRDMKMHQNTNDESTESSGPEDSKFRNHADDFKQGLEDIKRAIGYSTLDNYDEVEQMSDKVLMTVQTLINRASSMKKIKTEVSPKLWDDEINDIVEESGALLASLIHMNIKIKTLSEEGEKSIKTLNMIKSMVANIQTLMVQIRSLEIE